VDPPALQAAEKKNNNATAKDYKKMKTLLRTVNRLT
jgi:hypothetical protein